MDRMYQEIGKKIKQLAKATFIVEAIGAIITGFVLLVDWGIEDGWWALLIIVCGPIVAWVSSWLLYGFGELIDTNCETTTILHKIESMMILSKAHMQKHDKAMEEERKGQAKHAAKKPQKEPEETVKEKVEEPTQEPKVTEKALKVVCPKCKEDLTFMEFAKNDSALCPFCSFEFTVE